MANIDTEQLSQKAEKLKEEREANYDAQGAVRSALRNLRDAGVLSGDEKRRLEKVFPTVQRGVRKAAA